MKKGTGGKLCRCVPLLDLAGERCQGSRQCRLTMTGTLGSFYRFLSFIPQRQAKPCIRAVRGGDRPVKPTIRLWVKHHLNCQTDRQGIWLWIVQDTLEDGEPLPLTQTI